jgi:hypothetical protein
VAAGVALAMIAAHGVSLAALRACVRAGVATIALVTPWLVYVSMQMDGLGQFIQSGTTAAVQEHVTGQTVPRWPLVRLADLVSIESPDIYAPAIGLRWTRDSSRESRQKVIDQYGLTVVATRDDVSQTVRASEKTIDAVRALVAEPIVEDTDGIERGAGQISDSAWPSSQRRRFDHWWLRVRVLPGLDQVKGGEAATIFLFALPLAAIALAVPAKGYLPSIVTPARLVCFSIFALFVNFGVLRAPFHVRVGDAIVLPAILLGIVAVVTVRATRESSGLVRRLSRGAAIVVVVLMMKSLAEAGQSGERVSWVAGEFESLNSARGAWEEVVGRLTSSPPIDYWRNRNPEVALRLAAYARECVPESERILVLWFAPEIYYYSDRLMSSRHAFFLAQFRDLPRERAMEIEKVRRVPPVIVFTRRQSERDARIAFPQLFDMISHEYHVAGSIEDADRYMILVRNDRHPVREYGADGWPCYR